MSNTKERICATAMELFNEYGYQEVSMRQIAQACDIAIGNLTYYYKKKEDLLIAIIGDVQSGFAPFFAEELHGEQLLVAVKNSFTLAENNRAQYTFYYEHLDELANSSEFILQRTRDFQAQLYAFYYNSLVTLRADGVLVESVVDETLNMVACTLVNMATSWKLATSVYSNDAVPHASYATCCWRLLEPFVK